jgi:hypothetical protein
VPVTGAGALASARSRGSRVLSSSAQVDAQLPLTQIRERLELTDTGISEASEL